ncbi:unnamed protein product [Caenorhabditis angaria]|uniref:G-protein coupled receptors family 1 profile domain-containing protein n=1 Tax=Caenorhabditis angaria TaxID=860376 RepID=A0A9P1NA87_9PELO|nr:unnamed protein product [Caenorhabditis angaria]
MSIPNIYRIASIFSTILTTCTNLILVILTARYIKKRFGVYKYLIIIFSTVGIIFDATGFLNSPMLHSFDSGFIHLSPIENCFTRHSENNPGFDCHYVLFFGVTCFILLFSLGEVDGYTKEYVNKDFIETYGVVIDEISAFSFIVLDKTYKSYRCQPIFYIIFVTFTMLFQNAIIIFCGFKIRGKLYNDKCKYSPVLLTLHQQFFKTLVLQVTIPTLFIFLPIFLVFYAPFFGFKMSVSSSNVFFLFYMYPAIDSIIVMYVITEYKNALRDLLSDVFCIKNFNSRVNVDFG